MTRIIVNPENLEQLSSQMRQVALDMEVLDAALESMLESMDWNVREKVRVERLAALGQRQNRQLSLQAGSLSQFLSQRAQAFHEADGAGLSVFSGGTAAPPSAPAAPGAGTGTAGTGDGGSDSGVGVGAPQAGEPPVIFGAPINLQAFQAASDPERFEMIKPALLELEKKTGVPWQIQAAQWSLESGWGVKRPKDLNTGVDSLNMFGIKGEGPAGSVESWTTEEIDGEKVQVRARFRAYNTLEESLEDHARLLTKDHYKPAMACGGDLACWAKMLGPEGCGYATDSKYPQKLLDLMKRNGWT